MPSRVLLTPSVLVVNDVLDEREMYARTLRASGYRAIEAATFTAALQLATIKKPDIVVTDVRIAGSISGLELTRRLRNDPRTSTVPIIVLTNVSRPRDGDMALTAGADTFLEKPVPGFMLKAEILRLLARSWPLLSEAADKASTVRCSASPGGDLTRIGRSRDSRSFNGGSRSTQCPAHKLPPACEPRKLVSIVRRRGGVSRSLSRPVVAGGCTNKRRSTWTPPICGRMVLYQSIV
jgi:CheY-like chemotaxis protein